MGCAMQQGTTGGNIARKALLRAGLPVTVAAPPSTANAPPACRRLRWRRAR
jgi:acetyl-CoA acetyltransferase